jgi:hypothetical protein
MKAKNDCEKTALVLGQIRLLDDYDLIKLIEEIDDNGWTPHGHRLLALIWLAAHPDAGERAFYNDKIVNGETASLVK